MAFQVIGGLWGGRPLKSPPRSVRPTSAIVRRALFDILGPRIVGKACLDLYAGAGGLGIEALSRGAANCVFVERDRRTANVIKANLEALAGECWGDRARVHSAAVERWVAGAGRQLRDFDVVMLDPPYGDPGLDDVLARLAGHLRESATVVVERRSDERPSPVDGLLEVRRVGHGDTSLHLMRPAA